MNSCVENETQTEFDFDIKQVFDLVAEEVLDSENCPYEAQVNLLVTDNEGIREYNRQYRNMDSSTDVLSFPMLPFETEADFGLVDGHEADYFDPETG